MTTEQYAIGFAEGYEQGQADALDAPAKPVDCRGCMNSFVNTRSALACSISHHCADFDKFSALPPIVLTKVTK